MGAVYSPAPFYQPPYTVGVAPLPRIIIAPNWTSAAGALEAILEHLGAPLPRHAIMGISGHAWHTCLATRDGIAALPSGPSDLDWERMSRRYALMGFAWERFGAALPADGDWDDARAAAIEWATAHLDTRRPLIGWDFHLHEHAVVYGYDRSDAGFLVDDILTEEVGPLALWRDWPSAAGQIELFAPIEPRDVDPDEVIGEALAGAIAAFAGEDGPADGQPRGSAALDAWADAMDGDGEVDRAGNAYTLAVLQAARLDGAAFLADLAEALPDLAASLGAAEGAVKAEAQAISPLITLFPFPTGGHGNVANAGLRRGAAMALRRAATHERAAQAALRDAYEAFAG